MPDPTPEQDKNKPALVGLSKALLADKPLERLRPRPEPKEGDDKLPPEVQKAHEIMRTGFGRAIMRRGSQYDTTFWEFQPAVEHGGQVVPDPDGKIYSVFTTQSPERIPDGYPHERIVYSGDGQLIEHVVSEQTHSYTGTPLFEGIYVPGTEQDPLARALKYVQEMQQNVN